VNAEIKVKRQNQSAPFGVVVHSCTVYPADGWLSCGHVASHHGVDRSFSPLRRQRPTKCTLRTKPSRNWQPRCPGKNPLDRWLCVFVFRRICPFSVGRNSAGRNSFAQTVADERPQLAIPERRGRDVSDRFLFWRSMNRDDCRKNGSRKSRETNGVSIRVASRESAEQRHTLRAG